jgi:hypothetical protein
MNVDGDADGTTIPKNPGWDRARRGRSLRRIFVVVLVVFVGLGVANVYGVRSATVSDESDGYTIVVRYARVTRPGLATPWSVEIGRAGGFDGPITLATTASFFDVFDENGLDPDPASATSDGERLIWEFDTPPSGTAMTVTFDARIEPAVQFKRVDAVTELIIDDEVIAAVSYRMYVMP